jgi:hypothetical protein
MATRTILQKAAVDKEFPSARPALEFFKQRHAVGLAAAQY